MMAKGDNDGDGIAGALLIGLVASFIILMAAAAVWHALKG